MFENLKKKMTNHFLSPPSPHIARYTRMFLEVQDNNHITEGPSKPELMSLFSK